MFKESDIINTDCPCKKKKCIRHGDCTACRAYHTDSKRECYCERKYIIAYKFGLDLTALFLFAVIMLPNFIWFVVNAPDDILRNKSVTPVVDICGSVFQIITVAAMCLIVRIEKPKIKSIAAKIIIVSITLYYISWLCYYSGIVNKIIMLSLCITPCAALLIFCFKRKNWLAFAAASAFAFCHIWYDLANFIFT